MIPDEPSWAFVAGFIAAEILMVIIYIVLEWIARGK